MDKVIIGLFQEPENAKDVLRSLNDFGFRGGRVGILSSEDQSLRIFESELDRDSDLTERKSTPRRPFPGDEENEQSAASGVAHWIGPMGSFDLPESGTTMAAGPFAIALSAEQIRDGGSALIGALGEFGVPFDDARWFTEQLAQGGTMVAVEVEDDEVGIVADLMQRHGAGVLDRENGGLTAEDEELS